MFRFNQWALLWESTLIVRHVISRVATSDGQSSTPSNFPTFQGSLSYVCVPHSYYRYIMTNVYMHIISTTATYLNESWYTSSSCISTKITIVCITFMCICCFQSPATPVLFSVINVFLWCCFQTKTWWCWWEVMLIVCTSGFQIRQVFHIFQM